MEKVVLHGYNVATKYFEDLGFGRNFLGQTPMKLSLAMSSRSTNQLLAETLYLSKQSPGKLSLNVSFFSPNITYKLSTRFKKVNNFFSLISFVNVLMFTLFDNP